MLYCELICLLSHLKVNLCSAVADTLLALCLRARSGSPGPLNYFEFIGGIQIALSTSRVIQVSIPR
jgi:hypothetical protein